MGGYEGKKGSKISLKNHKKSSIFKKFLPAAPIGNIFFITCDNNAQKFSRAVSKIFENFQNFSKNSKIFARGNK